MKKISVLIILIVAVIGVSAQNWVVGKTYVDEERWTEFRVGNMPLVITVPHGGRINLDSVPDRTCPGAVVVTDNNTIELVKAIDEEFMKQYGLRPFIVICNLSRKEVDQNREIEIATCGNAAMRKPWNVFHDFADTALAIATRQFGGCIYIDLHGHGHPIQRLEVGYLLKPTELPELKTDDDLSVLAAKSSLNNLLKLNKKLNFKDLLTGDKAFGTMMANEGIAAIPSKQDVAPNDGEKYFDGGYNTRRYTSAAYPLVYGWQIETNFKGVRDIKGWPVFARAFAKVIPEYIKTNTPIKYPEAIK